MTQTSTPFKHKTCLTHSKQIKQINIKDDFFVLLDVKTLPITSMISANTRIIYKYVKQLVVTGYSELSLYSDENQNYIVVKYTTDNNEIKTISMMKKNKLICGIVEANYVDSFSSDKCENKLDIRSLADATMMIDIIVMPFYDGDLTTLSPELIEFKLNDKVELMIQITEQVRCLFDAGFCCTDLKYTNIFFKCHSRDKFTVHIGDIGGITRCGNQNSTSTFPSFISRHTAGYVANNNTVVWGLLMVFLHMFIVYDTLYQFTHSQIDNLSSQKVSQIIKALHTKENDKAIQFIYNCALQLMESDLSVYDFENELHKLM